MPFVRRIFLILLLPATQMHIPACAADLAAKDRESLSEAFQRFNASFLNFDADGSANQTFGPFMDRFGGKSKYAELLNQGYRSSAAAVGRIIISQITALPKTTVAVNQYAICFVGDITVWEFQGRKFRTNGYSLAVKNKITGKWSFIGGNAIRQNPALLDEIFPGLPKEFQVPIYGTIELS